MKTSKYIIHPSRKSLTQVDVNNRSTESCYYHSALNSYKVAKQFIILIAPFEVFASTFPPKNPRLLWKWVGGSRSQSRKEKLIGKLSENIWSSTPCVFCVYKYTVLKVVSRYDLMFCPYQ